jgi:hypothetical protein
MRNFTPMLFACVLFALGGCSGGDLTTNDLPVKCLDKPEPGPCNKRVLRYYYDYRYDQCRAFHYGGCQGHVPFETQAECQETCVSTGG